ncbi:MAG: hypothetical protein AAFQ87_26885, partial [Bacteroidota bacterium]
KHPKGTLRPCIHLLDEYLIELRMFDNILKPLYEFTEVFIKAAKADNDPIGKIPTANLSAILMGSANTIFMHAYQMQQVYGVDPFQPEEIERHADIINALVFGE